MVMENIESKGVCLEKSWPGGDRKIILDSIEAEFSAGRMAVIGGKTGAGKSTFLYVLAGLLRPTAGEVVADGQSVSRWVSFHRDLWRRKVGLIFQRDHFIEDMTVLENVCAPLVPRRLPLGQVRKKAAYALSRTGVEHLADESMANLSGGELQRVSCARALVSSPELILADEPTAHQDPENVKRLMNVFEQCREENAIVIVASHDSRILSSGRFDARYTMERGRLGTVSP
jgi:ABC-type lipoprotein export system ATPase subunit